MSSTNTTIHTAISPLTKLISLPINLLRTTRDAIASVNPFTFSFVQGAHVKLKADSMAMFVFCIARQVWTYVEGWRDRAKKGKRERERSRSDKGKKREARRKVGVRKGERKREGRRGRVVMRGRYTLILE